MGAQRPACGIMWLTMWRHINHDVVDDIGGIEHSGHENATVYEPTSNFIRVEQPKIEEKQRKFDKKGWRTEHVDSR